MGHTQYTVGEPCQKNWKIRTPNNQVDLMSGRLYFGFLKHMKYFVQ